MSELRVETLRMPVARLGPENPLPHFGSPRSTRPNQVVINKELPEEEQRYLGYGSGIGLLPYRRQDNYDRARRPMDCKVIVLENEILRATILIEFGARLWSLVHKPSGRELLHVNPVIQPANFAFRNAWVAGGVEWNAVVPHHGPFTLSPLFAVRLTDDDGTPVLRVYEWERIRGVPFQIDFFLPDGSPVLFVRPKFENPHDEVIPAYWWSNIAAVEAPGTRVLVPTDDAMRHQYDGGLALTPIPIVDGADVSYPTHIKSTVDYFYYIRDGVRPWIAAIDKHGRGLVQTSTARLKGRKLFAWGVNPGGQRWQEFLSPGGPPYIEIQAGVGRTQSVCLPMLPHAEWSWLEAYGLLEMDPAAAHNTDWAEARQAAAAQLEALLPADRMGAEHIRTDALSNRAPEEILHRGSGWAALERRRRQHTGEAPFCTKATPFDDDSLGEEQTPWLTLLETGEFPERNPAEEPGCWLVQPEWCRLLEEAVRSGRSDHWLAHLHLGVMYYHAEEKEKAEQAWRKSLDMAPSAWAYRNLAVLAKAADRTEETTALWEAACRMAPGQPALAIECGNAFLDAGNPAGLLDLLPALETEVRERPRIRIFETRAALEVGDLERVERILRGDFELTDLREGEVILTDLWFGMYEKRIATAENIPIDDTLKERVRREFPPPAQIDFRAFAKHK